MQGTFKGINSYGLFSFNLLGIHCGIVTVEKKGSVKEEGSVSIPCQYEPL